MHYIHIKNKKTPQGVYSGGVMFNNETVACFETLPEDVKAKINAGQLEVTTEQAYKAWEEKQKAAAANAERARAIRRNYTEKVAAEMDERAGREAKTKTTETKVEVKDEKGTPEKNDKTENKETAEKPEGTKKK